MVQREGSSALLPTGTFLWGYSQGPGSGIHPSASQIGRYCAPQPHSIRLIELDSLLHRQRKSG